MVSETTPAPAERAAGADPRSGTFRSVWRHRRWRWLVGSTVVSLFGDFLYWVALAVFLTSGSNPAVWLSASFIARLVPYVVLGPIGGAIADRVDRRTLLVSIDLSRGVLWLGIAGLVIGDAARGVVVALLVVHATLGAVYMPARGSAIPQIVPEGDLAAANAAEEGLAQLAWFVGPAVGALLVTALDVGVVLVIDAATFFLSATMVAKLGPLKPAARASDDDARAPRSLVSGVLRDVKAGATFVFGERGVRGLVVLGAAALVAFGAEQVLYVLVASERLDLGAEGVGYLLAAMGVGGVLAAPFSARAGNSANVGRWLLGSGALITLPMLIISLTEHRAIVFTSAVVEGAAAVLFDVAMLTLLQRAVVESAMGRVFSVTDAIGALGQTVGSVGAPVLVAAVGVSIGLRVAGGVLLTALVLLAPAVLALAARTDAERRQLLATTDELAAVEELSSFERIELERLARGSSRRTVPAGATVIVAGDAPDDLYVVRDGRLHVAVDDRPAGAGPPPDLGPGDLFGEIGLLRDIPRTATVTAATDVELTVIDGNVFVAVATPSAATAEPLLGGMRARLTRTHPHLVEREAVA